MLGGDHCACRVLAEVTASLGVSRTRPRRTTRINRPAARNDHIRAFELARWWGCLNKVSETGSLLRHPLPTHGRTDHRAAERDEKRPEARSAAGSDDRRDTLVSAGDGPHGWWAVFRLKQAGPRGSRRVRQDRPKAAAKRSPRRPGRRSARSYGRAPRRSRKLASRATGSALNTNRTYRAATAAPHPPCPSPPRPPEQPQRTSSAPDRRPAATTRPPGAPTASPAAPRRSRRGAAPAPRSQPPRAPAARAARPRRRGATTETAPGRVVRVHPAGVARRATPVPRSSRRASRSCARPSTSSRRSPCARPSPRASSGPTRLAAVEEQLLHRRVVDQEAGRARRTATRRTPSRRAPTRTPTASTGSSSAARRVRSETGRAQRVAVEPPLAVDHRQRRDTPARRPPAARG